jgi:pimeloyl-ACP methyl ester carboxylesterase
MIDAGLRQHAGDAGTECAAADDENFGRRHLALHPFGQSRGRSVKPVGRQALDLETREECLHRIFRAFTGQISIVVIDDRLLTERDLGAYVSAYVRTNSLYMNHAANAAYAAESDNEGYIDLPVLFMEAEFDYTCDCVSSRLAEPMHNYCRELTVRRIPSGHWMAQEKPIEVNAHLASWLAANVNSSWPTRDTWARYCLVISCPVAETA